MSFPCPAPRGTISESMDATSGGAQERHGGNFAGGEKPARGGAALARTGALVEREVRQESRRGANYWLRVLTGGVVVLAFGWDTLTTELPAPLLGPGLFAALRRTLALALWVLVPIMTADCVSRERREGTLGLLFLTPLTVTGVIVG